MAILLSSAAFLMAAQAHGGEDHAGAMVFLLAQKNNATHPYAFEPADVSVKPGETVMWYDTDGTDHTVTSTASAESRAPDGVFDYPLTEAEQEAVHLFASPGQYHYFCKNHSFMRGTVGVQAASTADTDEAGGKSGTLGAGAVLALLGLVATALACHRR